MVLVIKVIIKMEKKKVKVYIIGQQEVVIKDKSNKVFYKVLVNIYHLKILVIKENGKIIKKMDMERKNLKMVKYILDSTKVM